jgi:HK97 family phage major capsid protein
MNNTLEQILQRRRERDRMNASNINIIDPADSWRQKRLLDLTELAFAGSQRRLELRWPDHATLQRAALNEWTNDGPRTMLSLAGQLRAHSAILRAGATVTTVPEFADVVAPILNRSLEASWGASVDLGSDPISAVEAKPKRLSAYIHVSDRLRHQSPVLTGQFLERQLLSAIGTALDKAALVGTGEDDEPLGILNDDGLLIHTRAAAGIDSPDDLAAMESTIAEAHGEADPAAYSWLVDPATRRTLRTTEGTETPLWSTHGPGPFNYPLVASPHAPAGTMILAQADKIVIMDWNRLTIENLVNREQSLAGFRTMLVSGFFDVLVADPSAVCVAVDPE